MALGYRKAKELYSDTLNEITQSPENWISFLNSSTWMFKYTFGEQVLIYAQKPNAKACATMKDWNEKVSRWVKKNSTGITILKYENGKTELNIVFDVADTYHRFGQQQVLWYVDLLRDEKDFIETLESKYGELEVNDTFENAIVSSAKNLVEDNIDSYFEEMNEMLSAEQSEIFKNIVRDSVIYSVNTRLGIRNDDNLYRNHFEKINLLSDPYITTILGTACQELTRDIILEAKTFAKNKNHTFDKQANKLYIENIENNEEGRELNVRNGISRSERVSNTENRIGELESNENRWNILEGEGEILAEPSNREIRISENDRTTNTRLEPDTADLRRTGGNTHTTENEARENNGGIERTESNVVDSNDEQHQSNGTTGTNERNSVLLEKFEYTQEIIDRVLLKGSNVKESKSRIFNQFRNVLSSSENIKFLKNEYGDGGSNPIFDDINEEHSSKGITLSKKVNDNEIKTTINWKQAETRIRELIYMGRYLNEEEKAEYNTWLKMNDTIQTEKEQLDFIDSLIQVSNEKTVTDFEERNQELQSFFVSQETTEAKPILLTTLSNMINGVPPTILNNPNNEKKDNQPQELNQFIITDDNLGVGSEKEKFRNNINAIKLLKQLEEEKRLATKEEQETLSKYVGWGGLSKAFDERDDKWKSEYQELKSLLSEEEYENARSTVLTAFYTPPIVISAMYKALENMGFTNGNILEPSCRNW